MTGAGHPTVMEKGWLALGLKPLLAVTVPVKAPDIVVGVPEMTPEEERLSPGGNAPVVSEKVGVGYPLIPY